MPWQPPTALGAIFGGGRMRRLPGALPKLSAHLPLVMRPANNAGQWRAAKNAPYATETLSAPPLH